MSRLLSLLIGSALIAGAGMLHGDWTDRWETTPTVDFAGLDSIAGSVAKWDGQPMEIADEQRVIVNAMGDWGRRYIHRSSGDIVSVLILAGRPGPMSTHTPDVCYPSSGYELVEGPAPHTLSNNQAKETTIEAQFQRATFRKDEAGVARYVTVHWAWSADGAWGAPDYPRLTYSSHPLLYKIYFVSESPHFEENVSERNDPCIELARQLLPAVSTELFSN